MHREADLLAAIESDPGDDLAWIALADCLEENGEDDRAELVRLREWLRKAGRDDPLREENEQRQGALLIAGVRPSVPLRTFVLEGKVTLTLALIPPGSFWMGHENAAPRRDSEDLPPHRVRLTKPYWIGVTSITRAQWQVIVEPQSAAGPKPNHPAQDVLWAEATKFCKQLGKKVGGAFRLPTEAEWEHACRAGTTDGVYLGGEEWRDRAAWHTGNSRGHTRLVAKKVPNAWGLYDMLGNVWDWCSDGPRAYRKERGPLVDPVGPDGPRRAVKGGAWRSASSRCHAGTRYAEEPKRRTDDQGFRVVLDWE